MKTDVNMTDQKGFADELTDPNTTGTEVCGLADAPHQNKMITSDEELLPASSDLKPSREIVKKEIIMKIANKSPKSSGKKTKTPRQKKTLPAPVFDESSPTLTRLFDLASVFDAAESSMHSARTSLYSYLGDVYEIAIGLRSDAVETANLRGYCESLYSRPRDRKDLAEKKDTFDLVLLASLKLRYASLRSKYAKVMRLAERSTIAADAESFVEWLKKRGGVVKILQKLASSVEREKPKATVKTVSIEVLIQALAEKAPAMPTEPHCVSESYMGFSVALYYTNPKTSETHLVSDLADKSLVGAAVRAFEKLPGSEAANSDIG